MELATYIGKALQINAMLLDVSYNKISDDGVTAFSDYLKRGTNYKCSEYHGMMIFI